MREKHWFSLAQTHMAAQPKPKSEAEIAKKRAVGRTLTQLWRPEAPKNVHGGRKAHEKEANAMKRNEKESK